MPQRIRSLPPVVLTDALTIRRAHPRDASALEEATLETLPLLSPWFSWAESLERWGAAGDAGFRAAVAGTKFDLGEAPTYYLWDREDPQRLLGEISFGTEGWRYNVLSYSVWVRRSAAGRRIAAAGSHALLSCLFDLLDVEAVEALVRPTNHRSRRLVTSLGFESWGSVRDHDRFALAR